jgi:hypothetical protein
MTEETHFITYTIYKIVCKNKEVTDFYVGSTMNLTKRKSQHKRNCSIGLNRTVYNCIRENGNFDNWDIEVIDTLKCQNKRTAEIVERYYIEQLGATLNTMTPIISDVEVRLLKVNNSKKAGQTFHECECGCRYSSKNRARHLKTKRHLEKIKSNNNIQQQDAVILEGISQQQV